MQYRCAILDDYQNVALSMADWSALNGEVEIKTFTKSLGDLNATAQALRDFQIVCAMRERTPFPRALIEKLPNLKLIVTTGMKNAAIDVATARERGITVCGTDSLSHPTAELTIGLMIALARHIAFEANRMKTAEPWQVTLGSDLKDKTLGVVGLGRLGSRVAKAALALDMNVIAWSPNLTPEKCAQVGVAYATKQELLRQSDFVTIHMVLGSRSKGLIGANDFAQMKKSAHLINTSRGPIVDEAALIEALTNKTIAGAALDVYDTEPLPIGHALRGLPNILLTPHLGYVTQDNYHTFYTQTMEDIRAFLDGKPLRILD
jgi:phosphoglycerate dehydrogenase-like enzyme